MLRNVTLLPRGGRVSSLISLRHVHRANAPKAPTFYYMALLWCITLCIWIHEAKGAAPPNSERAHTEIKQPQTDPACGFSWECTASIGFTTLILSFAYSSLSSADNEITCFSCWRHMCIFFKFGVFVIESHAAQPGIDLSMEQRKESLTVLIPLPLPRLPSFGMVDRRHCTRVVNICWMYGWELLWSMCINPQDIQEALKEE